MDADYWIDRLSLLPHPEGGYFRETYRSPLSLDGDGLPGLQGSRSASTAIYFLVTDYAPSRLHRLATDEVWHHYAGDPLELTQIHPDGRLETILLGNSPHASGLPQLVVPAGVWFGGRVLGAFALCGCTMAPGFDFADFELGDRDGLLTTFPQHEAVILSLTR